MRYIDADKFAKQAYEVAYPIVHDINSHERGLTLMGIAQLLDEQPTADVRENVMGRWLHKKITDDYHVTGQCSNCHERRRIDNFCPNCGADMRGKQHDMR